MAEETATSQSPAATAQTPAEGLQELLGQTTVQVDVGNRLQSGSHAGRGANAVQLSPQDALRDDGSGYNDS